MFTSLRAALVAALVPLAVAGLTWHTGAADADLVRWHAAPTLEDEFVAGVNRLRGDAGLRPLEVSPALTSAARRWAGHLADDGVLVHADDLTGGLPFDWRKAGENIGRGSGVAALLDAFMASPRHRANVLDPAWTTMGVAVMTDGRGRLYTVHRFAELPGPQSAVDLPGRGVSVPGRTTGSRWPA